MGGDERYRSEADEIFYGQMVEDQKQDINWEIQQREMLHGGGRREWLINRFCRHRLLINARKPRTFPDPRKLERKVAEWRGRK